MSVVGRFEILSPVFSGAVDTSTARDPKTGETVLLHVLPPGHEQSPREFFMELAPGCPGKILDWGVDPETQRAFVVTDYPKDRKAVRLWIRDLIGLGGPPKPAAPLPPPPPKPAAEVQGGSTRSFDPAAIYGREAAAKPAAPEATPSPAVRERKPITVDPFAAFSKPAASAKPTAPDAMPPESGATRMFDPSAVFGASAAAAAKPARTPEPAASARPPAPAQDGATRMFDPSAVFGPSAAAPAAKAAAEPAPDSRTRMFDPSAVFGPAAAPAARTPAAKPAAEPTPDSGTRMFDPSAVFGPAAAPAKPAAKPARPTRPEQPDDSAKRAAEDFIYGRLPEEFRSAPVTVQRSLEELLGDKAKGASPPEEPLTKGRPGVITLLFDAYGKRVEKPDAPSEEPVPEKAEQSVSGATKMISSSDLSAFFTGKPEGSQPPDRQESGAKKNTPPRDRK